MAFAADFVAQLVAAVVGDPQDTSSIYKVNLEGSATPLISHTASSGNQWADQTQTVTVTDGYLTIGQMSGATTTKLDFIDITPVADSKAPEVTITPPNSPALGTTINQGAVRLQFSSDEPATFECQLDAAAFAA